VTTGIIVFAHGSRIEPANQAVRSAAAAFARFGDYPLVEAAFLELGRPSLEEAADLLVARGVGQIVVVPYFLTPGTHLERDLPALIHNISNRYKNIQILSTPSLDGHPALVQILADRVRSALVEPHTLK
jgi:sirohydrochlorin ferrochelatase